MRGTLQQPDEDSPAMVEDVVDGLVVEGGGGVVGGDVGDVGDGVEDDCLD